MPAFPTRVSSWVGSACPPWDPTSGVRRRQHRPADLERLLLGSGRIARGGHVVLDPGVQDQHDQLDRQRQVSPRCQAALRSEADSLRGTISTVRSLMIRAGPPPVHVMANFFGPSLPLCWGRFFKSATELVLRSSFRQCAGTMKGGLLCRGSEWPACRLAADHQPAKEQHISQHKQRRYRGDRIADYVSRMEQGDADRQNDRAYNPDPDLQ